MYVVLQRGGVETSDSGGVRGVLHGCVWCYSCASVGDSDSARSQRSTVLMCVV